MGKDDDSLRSRKSAPSVHLANGTGNSPLTSPQGRHLSLKNVQHSDRADKFDKRRSLPDRVHSRKSAGDVIQRVVSSPSVPSGGRSDGPRGSTKRLTALLGRNKSISTERRSVIESIADEPPSPTARASAYRQNILRRHVYSKTKSVLAHEDDTSGSESSPKRSIKDVIRAVVKSTRKVLFSEKLVGTFVMGSCEKQVRERIAERTREALKDEDWDRFAQDLEDIQGETEVLQAKYNNCIDFTDLKKDLEVAAQLVTDQRRATMGAMASLKLLQERMDNLDTEDADPEATWQQLLMGKAKVEEAQTQGKSMKKLVVSLTCGIRVLKAIRMQNLTEAMEDDTGDTNDDPFGLESNDAEETLGALPEESVKRMKDLFLQNKDEDEQCVESNCTHELQDLGVSVQETEKYIQCIRVEAFKGAADKVINKMMADVEKSGEQLVNAEAILEERFPELRPQPPSHRKNSWRDGVKKILAKKSMHSSPTPMHAGKAKKDEDDSESGLSDVSETENPIRSLHVRGSGMDPGRPASAESMKSGPPGSTVSARSSSKRSASKQNESRRGSHVEEKRNESRRGSNAAEPHSAGEEMLKFEAHSIIGQVAAAVSHERPQSKGPERPPLSEFGRTSQQSIMITAPEESLGRNSAVGSRRNSFTGMAAPNQLKPLTSWSQDETRRNSFAGTAAPKQLKPPHSWSQEEARRASNPTISITEGAPLLSITNVKKSGAEASIGQAKKPQFVTGLLHSRAQLGTRPVSMLGASPRATVSLFDSAISKESVASRKRPDSRSLVHDSANDVSPKGSEDPVSEHTPAGFIQSPRDGVSPALLMDVQPATPDKSTGRRKPSSREIRTPGSHAHAVETGKGDKEVPSKFQPRGNWEKIQRKAQQARSSLRTSLELREGQQMHSSLRTTAENSEFSQGSPEEAEDTDVANPGQLNDSTASALPQARDSDEMAQTANIGLHSSSATGQLDDSTASALPQARDSPEKGGGDDDDAAGATNGLQECSWRDEDTEASALVPVVPGDRGQPDRKQRQSACHLPYDVACDVGDDACGPLDETDSETMKVSPVPLRMWNTLRRGGPSGVTEEWPPHGGLGVALAELRQHVEASLMRKGETWHEVAIRLMQPSGGDAICLPRLVSALQDTGFRCNDGEVCALFQGLGVHCAEKAMLTASEFARLEHFEQWIHSSRLKSKNAASLLRNHEAHRALMKSMTASEQLIVDVHVSLRRKGMVATTLDIAGPTLAEVLDRCFSAACGSEAREFAEVALSRHGLHVLVEVVTSPLDDSIVSQRHRALAISILSLALEKRWGADFAANPRMQIAQTARSTSESWFESARSRSEMLQLGSEQHTQAADSSSALPRLRIPTPPDASMEQQPSEIHLLLVDEVWQPLLRCMDADENDPDRSVHFGGPLFGQVLALLRQAHIPVLLVGPVGAQLGRHVSAALRRLLASSQQAVGAHLRSLFTSDGSRTSGSVTLQKVLRAVDELAGCVSNTAVSRLAAAFGGCKLLGQVLSQLPEDVDSDLAVHGCRVLEEWCHERKKLLRRWGNTTRRVNDLKLTGIANIVERTCAIVLDDDDMESSTLPALSIPPQLTAPTAPRTAQLHPSPRLQLQGKYSHAEGQLVSWFDARTERTGKVPLPVGYRCGTRGTARGATRGCSRGIMRREVDTADISRNSSRRMARAGKLPQLPQPHRLLTAPG